MPPTYTGTFWKAECDAEKENARFLRAFSFFMSVYSFTSLYRQVISSSLAHFSFGSFTFRIPPVSSQLQSAEDG